MKRFLSFSLALCTIMLALCPLAVHTSPGEQGSTSPAPSLTTHPTSPTPPISPDPPLTEEPPSTEEPPLTEDPPITHEPTEEELLIAALYTLIRDGGAEYIHQTTTSPEDGWLEKICSPLLSDYPEFFHLDHISVETTSLTDPDSGETLYSYRFVPKYTIAPGEELDLAEAFVEAKTAEILSLIPEGADTFTRLLFLHDYICTHFSYDASENHRDIYSFLKNNKGNCQAYSDLYAFLLNRLNIENAFVTSTEMNHIWNQVQLDGKWYHVDLCWDDPSADQVGRALHTNFLRSDAGIATTNHFGFTAPNPCDSTFYEDSFLPDLVGAVVFLHRYSYAISRSERMILRIDWKKMTCVSVVDLSALRWKVWDTPGSLWKEQYLNLYTDGWLIYFNGPSSIWSFDPELLSVELLYEFDSSDGYLYSLSGNGHELTCTVSQAPGVSSGTFTLETPHLYSSEGNPFCSIESCMICGETAAIYSPQEEEPFTACISTRPSGDGLHDLRLLLFTDMEYLSSASALTVRVSLFAGEEERYALGTLSPDIREGFLLYESFWANGMICSVAAGYEIDGMILLGLTDQSYDRVTVSITQDEQVIYRASLAAEQIFAPPEDTDEPKDPDEPIPDDPEETIPDPEIDEESENAPEANGKASDGSTAT